MDSVRTLMDTPSRARVYIWKHSPEIPTRHQMEVSGSFVSRSGRFTSGKKRAPGWAINRFEHGEEGNIRVCGWDRTPFAQPIASHYTDSAVAVRAVCVVEYGGAAPTV
jgi:hypothetical protein